MRWGEKLRHAWHNIYYKFAGEKATEFALRCQHVAEQVDLRSTTRNELDTFRFYLHLSVCQACTNYYKMSRGLNQALKKVLKKETQSRLTQINSELLRKHSQSRKY